LFANQTGIPKLRVTAFINQQLFHVVATRFAV
jgi:hypothetical protein